MSPTQFMAWLPQLLTFSFIQTSRPAAIWPGFWHNHWQGCSERSADSVPSTAANSTEARKQRKPTDNGWIRRPDAYIEKIWYDWLVKGRSLRTPSQSAKWIECFKSFSFSNYKIQYKSKNKVLKFQLFSCLLTMKLCCRWLKQIWRLSARRRAN